MLKNIISKCKTSLLGILLLMSGYIIGVLVLSIGISIVSEANENHLDSFSGNPQDNLAINLITQKASVFSYKNILSAVNMCTKDVELQILNIKGTYINGIQCDAIVPVIYAKKPEWQIPLIKGRHFTPKEAMSTNRIAVIGKNIAKSLFVDSKLNSDCIISINNQSFKVIGIIGRTQRNTQWDSAVYIPMKSLPDIIENQNSDQLSLLLKKNPGDPFKVAQYIESTFKKIDSELSVNYEYTSTEQASNNQIWSNSIGVATISGIILLVAIINVANLSLFWILDRRREIAIRKAIGATDKVIIKGIILELVLIAIVSAGIAILIQSIMQIFLREFLPSVGGYLKVSLSNIIISSIISVLCGLITSIIPVRSMLKMKTIETLRID